MVLLIFHFVLVIILVQRKFTTARYVVYKWAGCKYCPSPTGEGLFSYFRRKGGMNEENRILYSKEQIFEDVPDPYPRGISRQ